LLKHGKHAHDRNRLLMANLRRKDMNAMQHSNDWAHPWPALNYSDWRDTLVTFQLWTQIVGKVRLALSPWLNHGWQVPLYVNARGLGTAPIHAGSCIFEIDLDLVEHRLILRTPESREQGFALEPMSVAAYSHEVSSAGFWPGNDQLPQAALYSYAYPAPQGFAQATIEPRGQAQWAEAMSEWLLPYDAVRTAADPDAALLRFLQTTYRAAADLAGWERSLECSIGVPGRARAVPEG
jgi:Family of unknown function (DUF5996)